MAYLLNEPPVTVIVNNTGGGGTDPDTKGQIITFDTAVKRKNVGADNTILTADSTSGDGLSWKSIATLSTLSLTSASNQLILKPGANQYTITASNPSANRVFTIPNIPFDADFVMTNGSQTINNLKTFGSQLTLAAPSSQLVFRPGNTGNSIILTAANPNGVSRTYTLPDVGANASFVMTAGVQTIDDLKTFTGNVVLTKASSQLIIKPGNGANQYNITMSQPSASRTYTLPDVGADARFLMSEGIQVINGTKVFSTTVQFTASANQLRIGGSNVYTITTENPALDRFYTLPDAGADANFVMSEGNQTINGTKTFTSISFPSGSPLNYYEEHTMALTTDTTGAGIQWDSGPQTAIVTLIRVGKQVTAHFDRFNVGGAIISTGINFIRFATAFPSQFWPKSSVWVNVITQESNSNARIGSVNFVTNGTIPYVYRDIAAFGTNWTNGANQCGYQGFTVSWAVA